MLRMDVIQQRAYTRKQMRCQLSCIVKCESEITKEKQDFEAVVHANLWYVFVYTFALIVE